MSVLNPTLARQLYRNVIYICTAQHYLHGNKLHTLNLHGNEHHALALHGNEHCTLALPDTSLKWL